MTNKFKYIVANWKMYGDHKTVKTLKKVIHFQKSNKSKKVKIIYCPPFTLLNSFFNVLKKTNIEIGAQNCHYKENNGPYTGFISSNMIKKIGCKYVIIGHSECRAEGDTNDKINKKIKSSIENNLKILFCIGESLNEKKRNQTNKVLKNQISKGLRKIKKMNNIIFAYEPIWSIGTGKIPTPESLERNINYIKKLLKKSYNIKNPKVLYGGSVDSKNIVRLNKISNIDGFLVGSASQNSNKFIDIIKKTYN